MSAERIVDDLRQADVSLWIDGDRLRYSAPAPLSEAQLATLRQHKPEILSYLQQAADPPPLTVDDRAEIQEAIEERAAIQEFDGGLPRAEAERQARIRMRAYHVHVAQRQAAAIWLVILAPGCELPEARAAAARQFGAERVLDIRPISERM